MQDLFDDLMTDEEFYRTFVEIYAQLLTQGLITGEVPTVTRREELDKIEWFASVS